MGEGEEHFKKSWNRKVAIFTVQSNDMANLNKYVVQETFPRPLIKAFA